MRDQFAHFHVHTDRSILDGAGNSRSYAERAALLGQPTLALTDHGSQSGAMAHWRACNEFGVRPVLGCELYLAPEDATLKQKVTWGPGASDRVSEDGDNPGVGGGGAYTHLTVLARTAGGLRNLFRLHADGHDRGFYQKPRVDLRALEQNADGLIVLSGCAGSALSTRLRLGQWDEAERLIDDYRAVFKDSFFVEIMHHGIPFEDALNRDLIEIARRHRVPLVATNDAHYCGPDDAATHAALLCVQTQSTLARPVFQFSGSGYHIASRAEMEAKPLPVESLDNTLLVAEMIESYDEVFERKLRFPAVDLPDGWTEEDALWELAAEGLSQRLANDTEEHWSQLGYECRVICNMGYPGYFLALQKVIQEGKRRGIRFGPGRGSAGGSLVAYALGITDLDPLVHGLIFERFLNPERASLPDIDIDIDESRRDEFLQLVREMYGDEYFAQIGTLGTFGARAALKDAVRVTGGTPAQGEWYAAQVPPPKFGRAPSITEYTGPRDSVYGLAEGFFGSVRNEGIHAAAVFMSFEPLRGLLPLRRAREKDTDKKPWPKGEGPWISCFTDKECEALGLVKMDFLGLRNLGIIDETLSVLQRAGKLPHDGTLPTEPESCNDPGAYGLLSRGETLGVFQLDSPGMRGLLRQLRPTCFDDISAVLALYRPGPMGAKAHIEFAGRKNQNGGAWKPEWAIHPDLEESLRPALESSYGLIVWQEQVLEVLKIVCGWSYAEAALLFDAMRKKNHAKMQASKPEFLNSGAAKGFSPGAMEALWDVLVPFADYSFNRAHSAGYGLLAYWTAFLKANHPVEYMAALLSSVSEDKDRLPEYLEEVNRMGIPLLPPDINASGVGFSPGEKGIHYGISAIKGVGTAVFNAVEAKRPYASVDDFFRRTPVKALNTGSLGALIASGTLDSLSPYREELYLAREALSARALRDRQERRAGQRPLYRVEYGVGDSNLRSTQQRQEWERQYLSTVLTRSQVDLIPTRPMTEDEFMWLRDLLVRNPGDWQLSLVFGRIRLGLPVANWPVVEQAVQSLGVFA